MRLRADENEEVEVAKESRSASPLESRVLSRLLPYGWERMETLTDWVGSFRWGSLFVRAMLRLKTLVRIEAVVILEASISWSGFSLGRVSRSPVRVVAPFFETGFFRSGMFISSSEKKFHEQILQSKMSLFTHRGQFPSEPIAQRYQSH